MSTAKKVPVKKASQPKIDKQKSVWVHSLFTDYDIDLFLVGKHFRLYEKMGSHLTSVDGTAGTYFAVWAPNAINVSVVGNFNDWNNGLHPLNKRWDKSGIWEGFIPGIAKGEVYKYFVKGLMNQNI
jgi:1,4-alpha-glucan branching enzyme